MIVTRGPKNGQCNICGDLGELSEDHTPPKGCYKPRSVELFSIIEHLAAEPPRKRGRISQNGVKYRTLCKRCNNTLLGAEYDPEFIRFVNEIGQSLRSSLALPSTLTFTAKPQRIMRSLLGHLAAQGVDRYKKGDITEPLRDYILNGEYPLPEAIRIYCWPFPYSKHVMARDCGLSDLRIGKPFTCWFLKFFPVGFLATFSQPVEYTLPGVELSRWRSIGIDDEVHVSFPLRSIPAQYWPEAPTNTSMVMYGKEAITSFPKRG